ncbi:MAG: ArnT family glycosyltransferase [Akkermansiaceae bacterium]
MKDNSAPVGVNVPQVIRRIIFFVMIVVLSIASLFFTFRGLSAPEAMEQAQIAREIANGNGYSTKVIRPVALWQIEEAGKEIPSLKNFPDAYHAPLNPCVYAAVFKAINAGQTGKWSMHNTNIYQLDRVIAAVCIIFFLLAIGVNYLLVSKIFDGTIGAVTALLMLFSELMWKFSQSGLPQMLMLLLFSCALLFLWKAVEKKEDDENALPLILIAGVFMCLLVLTHWITLWVYIGFVIFTAIYFKPRGVIATLLIAMLAFFIFPVVYFLHIVPTGNLFGTAFFAIYDGLGFSEDFIMRSLSPENQSLGLNGLLMNILSTTLGQISNLHSYFGAILVAPLFFLALLHPFKRSSIASFRWLILLMWVFGSVGMTIYGIRDGAVDSNQIHILFAPIMAGYGLALVSILWSRLNIMVTTPALKYSHFIVIVLISAGSMLLSFPRDLIQGVRSEGIGGYPHWPVYHPVIYNRIIAENTSEDAVIISDTPWAMAWYADRISVWLPSNIEEIEKIEALALKQQRQVSGVHISAYSFNAGPIIGVAGKNGPYDQLFPLVYGSWAIKGNANNFVDTHPKFKGFAQRYPYQQALLSDGYMMYYSSRPLVANSGSK